MTENDAPREFDFSRQRWGYALHPGDISEDGVMRATCHLPTRPRLGDRCWWVAQGQRVVAEFVRVEGFRDPMDMYSITLHLVEVYDGEGRLTWTRPTSSWWARLRRVLSPGVPRGSDD